MHKRILIEKKPTTNSQAQVAFKELTEFYGCSDELSIRVVNVYDLINANDDQSEIIKSKILSHPELDEADVELSQPGFQFEYHQGGYNQRADATEKMIQNLLGYSEIKVKHSTMVLVLAYKKKQDLRYGENPHQKAASYVSSQIEPSSIMAAKQLHGKELSYNNIYDANGAVKLVKEFSEPTAVAIKHANPCGVGSADTIYDAYIKAYECDDQSIFGGIVALNREVEKDLALKLSEIFLEIIIAPKFSEQALDILTKKKNIRLLELDTLNHSNESLTFKHVEGGLLLQESDQTLYESLEEVTEIKPNQKMLSDLEFGWKVAKHISSNGVVLVKDKATIGLGLGFVNRYFATQEALSRAGEKAQGAILASDGFFPFSDSMQALGDAGVVGVIQPGGSIKDQEVIDEANKQNISMVMTKMRHFRH